MTYASRPNWVFAAALLALLCAGAFAAAPEGAVTGTGRAVITRQPEILRLQMVVTADGKDITDATQKLKDAKASMTKKLTDLGAAEKSIQFGPTQVGAGEDPRQQYMQRMVMRNRPGAKAPEKPKTVTVSASLKAEWPLKAAGADDLVVMGYTLQEKISASGLAKKDAKQLTPEEQEALEEAQAMAAANGGSATPGEPTFRYVSKVSEAEEAKAMADAFSQAKSDAARIAKATGSELGTLIHVASSTDTPGVSGDDDPMAFQRMMVMRQMAGESGAPGSTPPNEAISAQAGPLELRITVTASFSIKGS